jgi:hypothetical protein
MRLQSAMEFLITYGWAILIMAVALAALYAVGVINPSIYAPHQCILSSGFTCLAYTINSMGILSLNLQQSTPDPVNVIAMACTQNGIVGNLPNNPPGNQVYMTVGSNALFSVQCVTSAGGPFVSKIGGSFSGTIVVNYTDELTKLPGTAYGKIALPVSSV